MAGLPEDLLRLTGELREEEVRLERLKQENEARRVKVDGDESDLNATVRNLLELQAQNLREKQQLRSMFIRYVVVPVATMILGGGSVAGYLRYQSGIEKQAEDKQVKASDVKTEVVQGTKAIDTRISDIERRLHTNELVDRRIVEIQQDQQIELSASVEYLSNKIDTISSRARNVKVPDPVTDGQTKAGKILESRGDGPAQYDPADPLGDILPEKPKR